jgi:hypothetical protein
MQEKHQFKNRLCVPNEDSRILRAMTKEGEHYDVVIPLGSSYEYRQLIADNAKWLSGHERYEIHEGTLRFDWEYILLFWFENGKVKDNNGEIYCHGRRHKLSKPKVTVGELWNGKNGLIDANHVTEFHSWCYQYKVSPLSYQVDRDSREKFFMTI